MTKKLLLTTALASLVAAPAFAGALIFEPEPEPMVQVAPAPAPAPIPMVPTWTGPYVGAQVGWGKADIENAGADSDDDGFMYGAQVGYDQELAGFVLGAELSYARLGLDPAVNAELDQAVRLLARAGFGFGRTMVYAKGGAAWLDGTVAGSDVNDYGWVAGGGVEHLVTDNISAGIEYLFHRVDDIDDTGIDMDAQTLAARVNYRF